MERITNTRYHIMALTACVIWGTTFISTKVLLNHSLSPSEIMVYRFSMAYIAIWFFCEKRFFANNLKDELLLALGGVFGGSLYFWSENTALVYTQASNVAIIISTAPILTALLTSLIYKNEKLRRNLIIGSVVAMVGVAMTVFNGSFILKLNPLGDMLTLLAALSWGLYNVVIIKLYQKYSTFFITRKIFFYGIITLLPIFINQPFHLNLDVLLSGTVAFNLIFLGLIASLACFIIWNISVNNIGAIRASNYIYITPLVTLITSSLVLSEQITFMAISGAVLILSGVYLAEKGFPKLR